MGIGLYKNVLGGHSITTVCTHRQLQFTFRNYMPGLDPHNLRSADCTVRLKQRTLTGTAFPLVYLPPYWILWPLLLDVALFYPLQSSPVQTFLFHTYPGHASKWPLLTATQTVCLAALWGVLARQNTNQKWVQNICKFGGK